MDRWDGNRRERERENPSFSSTLLDAIYRSIDKGHGHEGEEELVLYRESMMKKRSIKGNGGFEDELDISSLQRACMIEKWMEKKVSEKVVIRRKSVADFERKPRNGRDSVLLNSSSSSSDSSCGCGFSSSETESVHGVSLKSTDYGAHRPKPIRTSVVTVHQPEKFNKHDNELVGMFDGNYQQREQKPKPKPKHEGGGGLGKTKSRALKIYGDLNKKVKQPISPGGRLASFLNSLFTAGNAKKAKISDSAGGYDSRGMERKSKSAHASTCSSASSFSRSCLSKTPSSRGKLSNGTKRSVRFCPVNEIVNEDGQKSAYGEESKLQPVKIVRNSINEELKFHLTEKNRRVEEAARDLLKNYQKKVGCEFNFRNGNKNGEFDDDDDHDDDDGDAASYASSDLFELDNISTIGIERYHEELPVYETTHFDTNRAIANGLIM